MKHTPVGVRIRVDLPLLEMSLSEALKTRAENDALSLTMRNRVSCGIRTGSWGKQRALLFLLFTNSAEVLEFFEAWYDCQGVADNDFNSHFTK